MSYHHDDFESFFDDDNDISFKADSEGSEDEEMPNRIYIVLFSSSVAFDQPLAGFIKIDANNGIKEGSIRCRVESKLEEVRESKSNHEEKNRERTTVNSIIRSVKSLSRQKSVEVEKINMMERFVRLRRIFGDKLRSILQKVRQKSSKKAPYFNNNKESRMELTKFGSQRGTSKTERNSNNAFGMKKNQKSSTIDQIEILSLRLREDSQKKIKSFKFSEPNKNEDLELNYLTPQLKEAYKKRIPTEIIKSEKIIYEEEIELFTLDASIKSKIQLILPFKLNFNDCLKRTSNFEFNGNYTIDVDDEDNDDGQLSNKKDINSRRKGKEKLKVSHQMTVYYVENCIKRGKTDLKDIRMSLTYLEANTNFKVYPCIADLEQDFTIKKSVIIIDSKLLPCLPFKKNISCEVKLNTTSLHRNVRQIKVSIQSVKGIFSLFKHLDALLYVDIIRRNESEKDFRSRIGLSNDNHEYGLIQNCSVEIHQSKITTVPFTNLEETEQFIDFSHLIGKIETIETGIVDVKFWLELYLSPSPSILSQKIIRQDIKFFNTPKHLYSLSSVKRSNYFRKLGEQTYLDVSSVMLPFTEIHLGKKDLDMHL